MKVGKYKRTDEIRRKISRGMKGKKNALGKHWFLLEEIKREMSQSRMGRKLSEEHKRKISLGQKERYKDEKERKKTSLAMKGRKLSEKHRKNISERMKREWREGKRKPPMLGKHRSEETRRKLSQIQKGRKLSGETKRKLSEANKGSKHPNWGRHLSEETKNKIRNTKIELYKNNYWLRTKISNSVRELWQNPKYRQMQSGANHHWWKGGVTKREETLAHALRVELRNWAKQILERDNYTCQQCGLRSKEKEVIEVHHIEPVSKYPSLALDIVNGIALCKNCHYKTESYGKKLRKKIPKRLPYMNEPIKYQQTEPF